MTTAIVERSVNAPSYILKRREEVAEIIGRHSRELFGHANASIREVRTEAIRKNLESVFAIS